MFLEDLYSQTGDFFCGGSPSCYGDPNDGVLWDWSSGWFGSGCDWVSELTLNSPACGLKSNPTKALIFLCAVLLHNVANDPMLLPPEKHPWHLKRVTEYGNPSGCVCWLHETLWATERHQHSVNCWRENGNCCQFSAKDNVRAACRAASSSML